MRKWVGLIVAAAMAFNMGAPATALAARPVAGERSPFETWIWELMQLSDEASASLNAFQAWGARNKTIRTPEEARSVTLEFLPMLKEARVKLGDVRARLDAVKPYRTTDPYEKELAAGFLKDARDYANNLDQVLATGEELLQATLANDTPRIVKAMQALSDAGSVFIEGQLTMARGRQALFGRDEPKHYTLGALTTLYEGMRAGLYARVGAISNAQAAKDMRAAARRCRTYVAEGRRVTDRLAAEPGFVRGSDRYVREQLDIGAAMAVALDEGADRMERSDDPASDAFKITLAVLGALEERYIASVDAEYALPKT